MGEARKYPEIRALRFQYAMLFLPHHLRDDEELRKQWIDNNLTYLDAELLELYLEEDHNFMKFTWPEYTTCTHAASAYGPTTSSTATSSVCLRPHYLGIKHDEVLAPWAKG